MSAPLSGAIASRFILFIFLDYFGFFLRNITRLQHALRCMLGARWMTIRLSFLGIAAHRAHCLNRAECRPLHNNKRKRMHGVVWNGMTLSLGARSTKRVTSALFIGARMKTLGRYSRRINDARALAHWHRRLVRRRFRSGFTAPGCRDCVMMRRPFVMAPQTNASQRGKNARKQKKRRWTECQAFLMRSKEKKTTKQQKKRSSHHDRYCIKCISRGILGIGQQVSTLSGIKMKKKK